MMQVVMQWEIAAICFGVSAFQRRNKLGLGLGIVLLFYAFDLIARVIPDLSDCKILSPFSYANAADILSTGERSMTAMALGMVVFIFALGMAFWRYMGRDLAS